HVDAASDRSAGAAVAPVGDPIRVPVGRVTSEAHRDPARERELVEVRRADLVARQEQHVSGLEPQADRLRGPQDETAARVERELPARAAVGAAEMLGAEPGEAE